MKKKGVLKKNKEEIFLLYLKRELKKMDKVDRLKALFKK